MFMRFFVNFLFIATIFPLNALAEDAPLPFDVPSAAAVIKRAPVVNKPLAQQAPVALPAKKRLSTRSHRNNKHQAPANVHGKKTAVLKASKHRTSKTHSLAVKKRHAAAQRDKKAVKTESKAKSSVKKKQLTNKNKLSNKKKLVNKNPLVTKKHKK
jgi:hypothetical protein